MANDYTPVFPPRNELTTVVRDGLYGNVRFRVIDRISVDDVTLHLIRREAFRVSGGADPGVDVPTDFIDFLIRERYVV